MGDATNEVTEKGGDATIVGRAGVGELDLETLKRFDPPCAKLKPELGWDPQDRL